MEIGFKLEVEVVLWRQQHQAVALVLLQVPEHCSKGQTEQQAEQGLERAETVLRQQQVVVDLVADCQPRQLLVLREEMVELHLDLG